MNVKLNYASLLQQTEQQWKAVAESLSGQVAPSLRESLELILEQRGAVVDRRERLIPQPVIYAVMDNPGLGGQLELYGLKLEAQNTYEVKHG